MKKRGKKVVSGMIILGMALQLTACKWSLLVEQEDVMELLDGVAKELGAYQITSDKDLIGTRLLGEDAYAGRYLAECDGNTGKDVVFGGASVYSGKLYVGGYISVESGKATVRIRMNGEVTELEPDEDGYFGTELSLESGGNYIMVVYENFYGTVDLTSSPDFLADGTDLQDAS